MKPQWQPARAAMIKPPIPADLHRAIPAEDHGAGVSDQAPERIRIRPGSIVEQD
jgi:hypothetical protein